MEHHKNVYRRETPEVDNVDPTSPEEYDVVEGRWDDDYGEEDYPEGSFVFWRAGSRGVPAEQTDLGEVVDEVLGKKVATDGGVEQGNMASVDHESPYSTDPVQGTFERYSGHDVVTDGGWATDFPAYDGSGAVEPEATRNSEKSMGDLTRQ